MQIKYHRPNSASVQVRTALKSLSSLDMALIFRILLKKIYIRVPFQANRKMGRAQKSTKRPLCRRKKEGGLGRRLANLWSGRKITKRPTLFVAKKPNGKSQ
jgi:hypothetical protein